MITIESEEEEFFDEPTNRFITLGVDGVFTFNHCLKSIDEWESKYKKPFLTEGNKTKEELDLTLQEWEYLGSQLEA